MKMKKIICNKSHLHALSLLNLTFLFLIIQTVFNSHTVSAEKDGGVKRYTATEINEVCGLRMIWQPTARIVGGTNSPFGKYPWMASLMYGPGNNNPNHFCGAALLNELWIVTAAHCLYNFSLTSFVIRLGELEYSNQNELYKHVDRTIDSAILHPNYNYDNNENDIALVRMNETVTLQTHVLPVCLPQDDDSYAGKDAYITGWGAQQAGGSLQDTLREVTLPVVSNDECRRVFDDYYGVSTVEIYDHYICAGKKEGGLDACEGDSGGPLVTYRESDHKFVVIGIASFGVGGCGNHDTFGLYTRVSDFRDWIIQNIFE